MGQNNQNRNIVSKLRTDLELKIYDLTLSVMPLGFRKFRDLQNSSTSPRTFDKNKVLNLRYNIISYISYLLNFSYIINTGRFIVDYSSTTSLYVLNRHRINVLMREGSKIDMFKLKFALSDFNSQIKFGEIEKCKSYLIYGPNDDEPLILIKTGKTTKIDLTGIFGNIESNSTFEVGYNNKLMSQREIVNMYFLFGLSCKSGLSQQMNIHFNNYKQIIHDYFNDNRIIRDFSSDKFIRILAYYSGSLRKNIDIDRLINFISNRNTLQKCLLISKSISEYGGNQKTAVQIYRELSKHYDVKVFCMKKNKFTSEIPTNDIVKFENIPMLIAHINQIDYKFIIVNNLDQISKFITDLKNQKIMFFTHNCMAPFNSILIKHKDLIRNVLCVNESTARKLKNSGITCPINVYANTIEISSKIETRKSFKNKVAFIGRISPEKNVKLLIETWKAFTENSGVELLVIGDERKTHIVKHNKIKYTGYLEREQIKELFSEVDYVILPSYTEGLPHALLEAMSVGIPCIGSNINGINELIKKQERGFLFELNGYKEFANEIDAGVGFEKIINAVNMHFEENTKNLLKTLIEAYDISIEEWNLMSSNCVDFIKLNYGATIQTNENIKKIEMAISS